MVLPERYSPDAETNLPRSAAALFAAFVAIVVLSLAVDQILHVVHVYPPWGEPMNEPALNLLALSYRLVFGVLGSWLAARISPRNPMKHALILGGIGLVLSSAGAIATIPLELGPAWYPVSLVVTAMPCAWLGGVLDRLRAG
ncbi:MAG: hypothetical protein WC538_12625 [Thermoanaerobaculia bacterium]